MQATSQGSGTYYSDCSSFTFRDIDSDLLTREEQLALLEQDLTENLNRSEACLSDAAQASAERIAGAANSNGAGVANSEAKSNSGISQSEQVSAIPREAIDATDPNTSSAPSKKHMSGQNAKGSSAVCDAVRQGLAAATTEAETLHFQQLLKEYSCAG